MDQESRIHAYELAVVRAKDCDRVAHNEIWGTTVSANHEQSVAVSSLNSLVPSDFDMGGEDVWDREVKG